MSNKSYYYDIHDDIKKYPDALFIIVYGGRGTGKTYSGLNAVIEDKTKFTFIKRTLEDIKVLTAGNRIGTKHEEGDAIVDMSPFKPLNRDKGWNIRAYSTFPGMGGFFKCDKANNPVGDPAGYITALSGVNKVRGYDLSDTEVIIFDEFCPPAGTRVSKNEGEEILDMYRTISRDRLHRGLSEPRLWAFANADDIVCPLIEAGNLINVVAEMTMNNQEYCYIPEKRTLLHKLKSSPEFMAVEEKSAIYQFAGLDSTWTKKSLGNDFSHNDFSMIGKTQMKNMICEARVFYKNKYHFVYYSQETGQRYVTYSNYNKQSFYDYDLNKIIDSRSFADYVRHRVFEWSQMMIAPAFEKMDLQVLYLKYLQN